MFVLLLIGGAGGGDLKLTGALGAWLGAPTTMVVLLFSTPLAFVLMLGLIAVRRGRESATASNDDTTPDDAQPSWITRGVPYAVPVGVSCWSVLLLKLIAS